MSLFEGIEKDDSNACLNWQHDSLPSYIHGYQTAAEKLINDYKSLSLPERDTQVFPIIFLYRHYIELSLKFIIREINVLLNKGNNFPEHHKLTKLWTDADTLYSELKKILGNPDLDFSSSEERSSIKDMIEEFNKIDFDSFAFRYPKGRSKNGKSGEKNLVGLKYISLDNFKTNMQQLSKQLDNMISTICHEKDFREETRES